MIQLSTPPLSPVVALLAALSLFGCGQSLVRRQDAQDSKNREMITDIGLDQFQSPEGGVQFDPVLKVLSLNGSNNPSLTGAVHSPLLDMTGEHLVAISVVPHQPYNKELPALGLSDSGYPSGNLSGADIVGLYRLNEAGSSTFMDSSKYARHGSSGTMPAPTNGILRGAQKFSGTNVITVNALPDAEDSLNLKRYSGGSWMTWFSNDTPATGSSLLRKGADGNYAITYVSTATDSQIQCSIFNAATRKTVSAGVPKSSQGKWDHVACVYDGATLKMFLNGLQVASLATTLGIGSTNTVKHFYLGGNGAAGRYKGSLDEAAVYSRALGADEIRAIYERGEIFGVQYRAAATPSELEAKPFIGPNGPDSYFLPANVDSLNPPIFSVPEQDGMYVQIRIRYAILSAQGRVLIQRVQPLYSN